MDNKFLHAVLMLSISALLGFSIGFFLFHYIGWYVLPICFFIGWLWGGFYEKYIFPL